MGYAGRDVTALDISKWIERWPNAMIGLRLPKGVIGLDVDMYGEKIGRQTLRSLKEKYGPLPPTWVSTSRKDGSGIRLYRVPEDTHLHDPRGGIEVIQSGSLRVWLAGA
jgi:hypothetical protein